MISPPLALWKGLKGVWMKDGCNFFIIGVRQNLSMRQGKEIGHESFFLIAVSNPYNGFYSPPSIHPTQEHLIACTCTCSCFSWIDFQTFILVFQWLINQSFCSIHLMVPLEFKFNLRHFQEDVAIIISFFQCLNIV